MSPVTELMLARSVSDLPMGDRWAYEPKLDGFRAQLVIGANGSSQLYSRQGRLLGPFFPELMVAAEILPAQVRLDGEIVIPRACGVDFAALQERLHPAARRVDELARWSPAALIAFDVLNDGQRDLRELSYDQRRQVLVDLVSGLSESIGVVPMVTDAVLARSIWLAGSMSGVEGCVAKRRDQRYRPGVRGWQKVRLRRTDEAIVGGVTGSRNHPTTLILGRPSADGHLRVIGRTSLLNPTARALLGRQLTEPNKPHPWPETLPAGRFGQHGAQRIEYTQVQPSLIVEIEHDTAFARDRYRYPVRFLRVRRDLVAGDLDS
jgi:ATP-dependent DNA ligase